MSRRSIALQQCRVGPLLVQTHRWRTASRGCPEACNLEFPLLSSDSLLVAMVAGAWVSLRACSRYCIFCIPHALDNSYCTNPKKKNAWAKSESGERARTQPGGGGSKSQQIRIYGKGPPPMPWQTPSPCQTAPCKEHGMERTLQDVVAYRRNIHRKSLIKLVFGIGHAGQGCNPERYGNVSPLHHLLKILPPHHHPIPWQTPFPSPFQHAWHGGALLP